MQSPIPLFSSNIIEENKCSICLDNLSHDIHKIPECGHEYHNNCLISWLRSGNSSCPVCRDDSGYVYFRFKSNKNFIIKSLISYSKKNKIDTKIMKLLEKYKKITNTNKLHKQTIKKIIKKNKDDKKKLLEQIKFITKEEVKIQKQIRNNNRKLRDIENIIDKIPLCPIKIK